MWSETGGEHEVDNLDGILGERMLQAWKLRANALRKDQRCLPSSNTSCDNSISSMQKHAVPRIVH